MTEKDLEIEKLKKEGNREANLVKNDLILIIKATLIAFLIMLFLSIIFVLF